MVAKEIMTKNVVKIGPTASVKQLANLLTRHRISGVPVVENGKIVGIATHADLLGKKGRQVRSIMSAPVLTVSEETPVEAIANVLSRHRIKRVPVVRGNRLVGIVSRADIVRALARGEHIAIHTPIYDL
jgi:CBS domain-containing protein